MDGAQNAAKFTVTGEESQMSGIKGKDRTLELRVPWPSKGNSLGTNIVRNKWVDMINHSIDKMKNGTILESLCASGKPLNRSQQDMDGFTELSACPLGAAGSGMCKDPRVAAADNALEKGKERTALFKSNVLCSRAGGESQSTLLNGQKNHYQLLSYGRIFAETKETRKLSSRQARRPHKS